MKLLEWHSCEEAITGEIREPSLEDPFRHSYSIRFSVHVRYSLSKCLQEFLLFQSSLKSESIAKRGYSIRFFLHFVLLLMLLLFVGSVFVVVVLFVYRVHKNDENVCTTSCNFAHNILGPWNVSWRGRRIFDVKKIFSKIAMSNPRNLWTYEYHMKNTLNVLFGQTSQDERLVHNLYTESEKSVLRSFLWNVSSWNVLW